MQSDMQVGVIISAGVCGLNKDLLELCSFCQAQNVLQSCSVMMQLESVF